MKRHVFALTLVACGSREPVHPPMPAPTPPTPSAPTATAVAPVAKTSRFALVAVAEVSQFHKLADGSVLAYSDHALHALRADGHAEALTTVFRATKAVVGETGRVGGSWPGTLFVEKFRIGPGSAVTTGLVVRGDAAKATIERRVTGSYWMPPRPWKNGSALSLRVDGASALFGDPLERGGRFEVVRGKEVPPRLPKEAIVDDAFLAYPTGEAFALGGKRSRPVTDDASEYEREKGFMLDRAIVWQAQGASMVPVQLPGTKPRDRLDRGRLAAGRNVNEMLVYGILEVWTDRQAAEEPYLARFGPKGWHRVPTTLPVIAVDTGADGATFAIRGSDQFGHADESFLEKVTFTEDGGVTFVREPLEPKPEWLTLDDDTRALGGCDRLRPRTLAVLGEADVWLAVHCVGKKAWSSVLLHTQKQARPFQFEDLEASSP